jgi:hypothetical protein
MQVIIQRLTSHHTFKIEEARNILNSAFILILQKAIPYIKIL